MIRSVKVSIDNLTALNILARASGRISSPEFASHQNEKANVS